MRNQPSGIEIMRGSVNTGRAELLVTCSFRLILVVRLAEQVDEEAIGSRNASGQLAKEGKARVNVDALAVVRVDERAFCFRLAGILKAEHGLIFRVKFAPEI